MAQYKLKKYGLRLKPPAIVVYYEDTLLSDKLHKRVMPVRNLQKSSGVRRLATDLKNRQGKLFEDFPLFRLEKLLRIMQEHMKGFTLEESIQRVQKEFDIQSDEDLNKLDDETLARKKELMHETFRISNKSPGDPDFEYDVEKEFDNIEASGWDSDLEMDI